MVRIRTGEKLWLTYLVQVPAARGSTIPDIASIKDDFNSGILRADSGDHGRSTPTPTLNGN